MNEDPLALDREAMRRLGYRTIDMPVERLTDASAPPLRRATPSSQSVNDFVHAFPDVERALRRALHERLSNVSR